MIINLSSNGESNHANFINRFTDNIIIKPNSKICLTRISLLRDGRQSKITIPANTTMSFRYTPYDIITQTINVVDTEYSAEALANRLNVLFGGLKSFNYTFEARANSYADSVEIEFTSYLDNTAWENTNLQDFLFTNGDKARKMTTADARLISGGAIPSGTINANDEVRSVLWDTSGVTNGFGAKWGSNYTPPTAQVNKNAFNMYCSGGTKYGSSFVTVVNPTFSAIQEIRIGPATYDDAANDYSLICIPGNLGNNAWFFQLQLFPSGTDAISNGTLLASMYNNETETREPLLNSYNWFCGDTFEFYVDAVVPSGTEPNDKLFTFNVKNHSREGLIAYIPSVLDGTKYWNVEVPDYMSPADYWMKYGLDKDALEDNFNGNKIYGSRLGRGIRDTEIIKENIAYVTSVAIGTTTAIEYSSVVGSLRGVGNYPFYRAYSSTSPVTDTADFGAHTTIGNGLPIINVPTLITCVFQLEDKTAFTTDTIRTVISGSTVTTIKIDTAGAAYDLELTEADGTTHQINLVDSTVTRIVFNFTNNYYFALKSYGNSINPQVDILISDLTTNTDYTGTATMTGTGLDKVEFLAGNPVSNNNQNYLHGYLGEFRFFQRPADFTGDITYWNNKVDYLKNYYNNTGVLLSENAYWAVTDLQDVYTASAAKYGNYGTSDSMKTMTPAVMRVGGDTIFDANGYNFSDLFFFPMMTMPDDNRDVTINNIYAYGNAGMGIVNSDNLDNILDIEDYDTVTSRAIEEQETGSSQDTIDNPIFNTISEVETVELDDKIFNVQIKNLPHRNYNGAISNFDKTIYQIGSLVNAKTIEDKRIIEIYPPQKVYSKLENAGDIVLNQIEVMITDELNKEETDLKANTNLTVEIIDN